MLATAISWNARVLLSPRGFHLCLAAYLIVLFVARAYLFPGASEDDAEQLFFAQAFAWGYKPKQPPLYTWLVLIGELVIRVLHEPSGRPQYLSTSSPPRMADGTSDTPP